MPQILPQDTASDRPDIRSPPCLFVYLVDHPAHQTQLPTLLLTSWTCESQWDECSCQHRFCNLSNSCLSSKRADSIRLSMSLPGGKHGILQAMNRRCRHVFSNSKSMLSTHKNIGPMDHASGKRCCWHCGKHYNPGRFAESLLVALPQAPENHGFRSVIVRYSCRYTPFQLSLRYKETPAPVGWFVIPAFQVQGSQSFSIHSGGLSDDRLWRKFHRFWVQPLQSNGGCHTFAKITAA